MRECVLYYAPAQAPQTAKLKGILVRMGIRIRTVAPEQTGERIGALAGMDGYETGKGADESAGALEAEKISDEVLVMCLSSERRLEELLAALRKGGIRIPLKAVVTKSNCDWTFCELYEELKREHEAMASQATV